MTHISTHTMAGSIMHELSSRLPVVAAIALLGAVAMARAADIREGDARDARESAREARRSFALPQVGFMATEAAQAPVPPVFKVTLGASYDKDETSLKTMNLPLTLSYKTGALSQDSLDWWQFKLTTDGWSRST